MLYMHEEGTSLMRSDLPARGPAPSLSHRSPTETRLRSFHKGACAAAGPPFAAASGAKYFWIVAGSSFLRTGTIESADTITIFVSILEDSKIVDEIPFGRRTNHSPKRKGTHHFEATPFLRSAFLTGAQLKRATFGNPKIGSKLVWSQATVLGSVREGRRAPTAEEERPSKIGSNR